MILAALAGLQALRAQTYNYVPAQVPLERLCQYAGSSQLSVTTASGETVEGVCFVVNKDELQMQTKTGVVSLARAQLSRVRRYEIPRRHQLAHLGSQLRHGIERSASIVPTPLGLFGLIGIGGTLAYGAVGAPFAAMGDLFGYTKSVEIHIK